MADGETEHPTERSYAELLRDYRTRLGLSQDDLAAAAGVDVKTVRNHEHGEGTPQERVVAQLAAALETKGARRGVGAPEIATLRAAALKAGAPSQNGKVSERPTITAAPPAEPASPWPDAPPPDAGRSKPREPDRAGQRPTPRGRRRILLVVPILVVAVPAAVFVVRQTAAPSPPPAGAPGQAQPPAAPGNPPAGGPPDGRTLELTPPRETRYLTLRITALRATLTNATPESRASVEVLIKNEGLDLVLLGSAAQLQLADGRTYGEADAAQGWPTVYRDGATRQATLHFVRLPADASWRGAKLLITRRNEEPAVLPLDGPPPPAPAPDPIRFEAGTEVAVGPWVHRLLEATLGLDYTDSPTLVRRAGLGQRILRLRVRATNISRQEHVVLLGQQARVLVDGVPITPLNGAWMGLLQAGATREGHVAFEIPAAASRAEVRFSWGQESAGLPLPLR